MNFDYDIFISYGSSETSENDTTNQWAAKFCECLAIILNRLSNRNLTFLLHDDLRSRKQLLGTESPVVLTKTAVFVTILSPEFTGSESYQKELMEVFNAVYQGTDETSRNVNRIFKVLTLPIGEDQQPECLVNEIAYDFYEINRFSKKPKAYDILNEDQPEEKFWFKLIDLAYDIYNSLELLVGRNNQVSGNKKYVYLAETSFDQSESRDEIRRELQHLGYNILPLIKLPNDNEQIEALVTKYLNRSVLSIHLMGAFYGDFIKNSKHSLIDIQNINARIAIENTNNSLKRIIWIPSDLKTTDQRQSLYLNRLKRDESSAGTEIVEAPIEVFKTILKNRLQELEKPAVLESFNKKVYMIFENGNKDELLKMYNLLQENGIDIIEPVLSNQEVGIITNHKQKLVDADAVLIYQGKSNKYWLNSKVQDLVKAPGYGKEKPYDAIGLITTDNIEDSVIKFLHETVVYKSNSVDDAFCLDFVNQIKQKENGR